MRETVGRMPPHVQAEEEVHGVESVRHLLLEQTPQVGSGVGEGVGVDRVLQAVEGVDDALAATRGSDAEPFDDPGGEGGHGDGFGHGEAPVGWRRGKRAVQAASWAAYQARS